MRTSTRRRWLLAVIVSAVAFISAVAAAASQTVRLQQLMQQKLQYSQQALGALVTSDWRTLERDGLGLTEVTRHPDWMVLQTPEYQRFSARFVEAVEELTRAAGRRDLDEAANAYTGVVARCVDCHRYVQLMRMAFARTTVDSF